MTSFRVAIFAAFASVLAAEEEPTIGHPSGSPDKKWEYRVNNDSAVLVKAGSDEPVVDFGEEIGHFANETGRLVWAPDSRRFAFNTRKGGKYFGSDLYELTGTTWEKLPELETGAEAVNQLIERSLTRQLQRLGGRKNGSLNTIVTRWRLLRWLDRDTFEGYASEGRRVLLRASDDEPTYFGCSVLFRAKCDNRGGWKVTTSRVLSDAENQKIAESDED